VHCRKNVEWRLFLGVGVKFLTRVVTTKGELPAPFLKSGRFLTKAVFWRPQTLSQLAVEVLLTSSGGLHACGHVDRVSKQTVARHYVAHNASHHRTSVQTCTPTDRIYVGCSMVTGFWAKQQRRHVVEIPDVNAAWVSLQKCAGPACRPVQCKVVRGLDWPAGFSWVESGIGPEFLFSLGWVGLG